MAYPTETKNRILDLLSSGKSVKDIIAGISIDCPSSSTIYKWKKYLENVGEPQKIVHAKNKASRKEWRIKDYSKDEQERGEKMQEEVVKFWKESFEEYKKLGKDVAEKYEYAPKKLDLIESGAREKYHGESLESKLHLGIYQVKKKGKCHVRTKEELKLTSQNHIFPDSKIKIEDKKDSYHPENIREGNAMFNNYIKDHIDPIFSDNGKSLSEGTINIIKKYSLKPLKTLEDFGNDKSLFKEYLKDQASLKYSSEDRIVTSNMVTQLDKSLKGSYEAPELGIMDGPNKVISMKAYTVCLYKINSTAGIIDTCTRNSDDSSDFEDVSCIGDLFD